MSEALLGVSSRTGQRGETPGGTHSIVALSVAGRAATALVSPSGLVATIVPDLAMLCASLRQDGRELLGLPASVPDYADGVAQTGVPLLHPWANRLSANQLVGLEHGTVDAASPLVPTDDNGLAIHGLRLVDAGWQITERVAGPDCARVQASLQFDREDLLAVFPFPHRLTVRSSLSDDTLTIATELRPIADVAVPVSFGWHPYFRIPGVPRTEWRVRLPVRRRAILDGLQIPTGRDEPVRVPEGPIGTRTYDDFFTKLADPAVFSVSAGNTRIEVHFDDGYPFAQVYAPSNRDVIAFEPMTAPVNALVTGDGLRWVAPGASVSASFRIRVVS